MSSSHIIQLDLHCVTMSLTRFQRKEELPRWWKGGRWSPLTPTRFKISAAKNVIKSHFFSARMEVSVSYPFFNPYEIPPSKWTKDLIYKTKKLFWCTHWMNLNKRNQKMRGNFFYTWQSRRNLIKFVVKDKERKME